MDDYTTIQWPRVIQTAREVLGPGWQIVTSLAALYACPLRVVAEEGAPKSASQVSRLDVGNFHVPSVPA